MTDADLYVFWLSFPNKNVSSREQAILELTFPTENKALWCLDSDFNEGNVVAFVWHIKLHNDKEHT